MKKEFVIGCLTFCLLFSQAAFANNEDWSGIDRFLQNQHYAVSNAKDLQKLAANITAYFPDSLSRLKAVYAWVSDNISYQTDEHVSYKSVYNLDSVIKYKSAVCAGYVNVFAELCNLVGITCKEVAGYGRSGSHSIINEKFSANHSWAAVWLNGKWQLIDVTWGSGYTIEGTTNFIRKRNDWFFFTAPEKFILDHYPKDAQWQLLKDTVSWQTFINYPGIGLGARENEVTTFSPMQAQLNTKAGEVITFSFKATQPINTILFESRQIGYKQVYDLQKVGNTYYCNFKIPKAGTYDLQIDLSNIDRSKPGTYASLVDFVYAINAQ